MAAKELIQGLQHQPSEASKKQIIKLATTYGNIKFEKEYFMQYVYHQTILSQLFFSNIGLVSYFTSFVAVVSMDQTFVNL